MEVVELETVEGQHEVGDRVEEYSVSRVAVD